MELKIGQRMRMGGAAPSILSGSRIEDNSNEVDHSSPLSGHPDRPRDPPIRMSRSDLLQQTARSSGELASGFRFERRKVADSWYRDRRVLAGPVRIRIG